MGPPLVTRQVSNLLVVHFIGRLSLETKPRPESWPTLSIVWRRLALIATVRLYLLCLAVTAWTRCADFSTHAQSTTTAAILRRCNKLQTSCRRVSPVYCTPCLTSHSASTASRRVRHWVNSRLPRNSRH